MTVHGAGPVAAAPTAYTGTANGNKVGQPAPRAGNKVVGTSRCTANQVTVMLTVDGPVVTGTFQEVNGSKYRLAATRDAKGAFSTDIPRRNRGSASSGGPSHAGLDDAMIHVRGTISDVAAEISIEDTCLFKVPLTRQ